MNLSIVNPRFQDCIYAIPTASAVLEDMDLHFEYNENNYIQNDFDNIGSKSINPDIITYIPNNYYHQTHLLITNLDWVLTYGEKHDTPYSENDVYLLDGARESLIEHIKSGYSIVVMDFVSIKNGQVITVKSIKERLEKFLTIIDLPISIILSTHLPYVNKKRELKNGDFLSMFRQMVYLFSQNNTNYRVESVTCVYNPHFDEKIRIKIYDNNFLILKEEYGFTVYSSLSLTNKQELVRSFFESNEYRIGNKMRGLLQNNNSRIAVIIIGRPKVGKTKFVTTYLKDTGVIYFGLIDDCYRILNTIGRDNRSNILIDDSGNNNSNMRDTLIAYLSKKEYNIYVLHFTRLSSSYRENRYANASYYKQFKPIEANDSRFVYITVT